jgi:nanoRNase/pAp phosphatase (c-di-AMP/oligoRNAs hydrolase)
LGLQAPNTEDFLKRARPKLQKLVDLAKGHKTLIAQTHDYPDPDTIASAWALAWLLDNLAGIEGQIGYGGIIGRAENRAMIRLLGVRLRKTTPADFKKHDLVALLDTQPECGNHSIPASIRPNIVVDHHFLRDRQGEAEPEFEDIGGDFGSTSTKMTELVRASELTPPAEIATALFYGVKSDTANLARLSNAADLEAYLWLFPQVDTKLLADIENPQVPLDYFRVFNKAIERGKIYGNAIVADLGSVYTPDLCAELADRLLQVEGIRHAIATGWYEESLFISVRTRSRKQNAGKILHTIVSVRNHGSAGGHGPMAGARIPLEGRSQRAKTDLRRRLVQQILHAFGQNPRHYKRIVSRAKTHAGKTAKPIANRAPRVERNNGRNGEKKAKIASKRKSVAPTAPSP